MSKGTKVSKHSTFPNLLEDPCLMNLTTIDFKISTTHLHIFLKISKSPHLLLKDLLSENEV
jgi:hypothetical protein